MYKRIQLIRLAAILNAIVALGSCTALSKMSAADDKTLAARPNILLIVADDLALGDLSLAGSEIRTPNIDRLSTEGVRFTRFYTAATCAPTRAMLMTGVDANVAGLGIQEGVEYDLPDTFALNPAYAGKLNNRVVTVATRLSGAGYFTFMAGKWHLGSSEGNGPASRGFEKSYMMPHGGASHFDSRGFSPEHPETIMVEDGRPVPFPEDFYSTDFYTNKTIEYIRQAEEQDAPFFGYVAYTAPHWPLQAPSSLIEKHMPSYLAGWDQVRSQRFAAQKRLGLIEADAVLPPRWPGVPAWNSLSTQEKARQARIMATYAAMVDRLDSSVGRLIATLEETGALENTIIIFMSDNGAAAEDFSQLPEDNPIRQFIARDYPAGSVDAIGGPNAWAALGRPWAQVSSVQFHLHKATTYEGGVRSPLIIVDPHSDRYRGVTLTTPWHVTGIASSILDWAGVREGNDLPSDVVAPTGIEYSKVLAGRGRSPIVFTSLNSGMVIDGDWKIVRQMKPAGDGKWHLYNMATDSEESRDLLAKYPDQVGRMLKVYSQYMKENNLFELPECWNAFNKMLGGKDNAACRESELLRLSE